MRKKLFLSLVVLGALALSGCAAVMTGGGFVPSQSGSGNANFGFTYDGPKGKFSGTYHDRNATSFQPGGVKFSFASTPTTAPDTDTCMDADFTYRSTNPAYRGSGSGNFEACDGGEGQSSSGDTVYLSISSGPYAGYSNSGSVVGGNIQTHTP